MAVLLVHLSSPKGVPRVMHFLTVVSLASVCGLLTSDRHWRGSGGFLSFASHAGLSPFCCRAQAEPYSHSSARLTKFARSGLRSQGG
ncbi:hypothetical protein V202x_06790 [Gimesia aquarii]|uniref:Uncharacterized protein n=1 Tax=Gimesia aquarii TaxID=2527964 RepID=A0A517WPY1_9PLAN|nr:hypothetical protein V202x_06790 [Gimesia aquarii]